jgi:UDP-glucose 4-epimerase
VRALVAGGAGFLGSTLVDRLLAEGHAVDVVDDLSTGALGNLADARAGGQEVTVTSLDVRSAEFPALVARRRPDVVYHLATPGGAEASLTDPIADAGHTVLGALAVLEAARHGGVTKVVVALSPAIYGAPAAGDLPVRESQGGHPVSPRGVAEKAVADYLAAYRDLHNVEYTALVLADVYGPRQRTDGPATAVAAMAARLLGGQACTLPGDGSAARDVVFVDDAVDALARAGQRGGGLLLNVGNGPSTSLDGLYLAVATAVGVDLPARYAPAPAGLPVRSGLDTSRAGLHLGWRPWTTLAEGVGVTVEWVRSTLG